ncbi:molecular chaperone DnaJ [Paramagnetospirillum marisnigri]|uniref:Molecular chaperone DnaJ n=1 Tax=Paramagnetospirillum marisnigri TaxID=1285242 RepID=A0A178MNJ2_9PROT|nr:J domain-containing protein [Paramagnetospirillum marisnigri]OAN50249.1 molecular chaperone DnaJ [Paramagnetospirillum marisnigri]
MRDQADSVVTATIKHSYTVPCSSAFRDAVEQLAARRKVNVGDIARSVLLVVSPEALATCPDPGEPPPEDRETVILKSGPAQGRPWRRKPRLQVRMAPGYQIDHVRRALGLALAMEQGAIRVRLEDPKAAPPPEPAAEDRRPSPPPREEEAFPKVERRRGVREQHQKLQAISEEIDRLKAIISVLAFEPLPDGVQTRAEALYVLGFAPGDFPDARTLRAKFRMLATIHHPDSNHGDHQRMSQLNQAMQLLRDTL